MRVRGHILWLAAICGTGCASMCGRHGASSESGAEPQAQVRWSVPVEVATGRADAGPWQMNESHFDYVDDPSLAWGEGGSLGVVWADNARKDVYFQMFDADGQPELRSASNVSQSPRVFSWLPRLLIAQQRVFVLWQEIVFSGGSHGGEIFFARSEDAGQSFSAPLNLSRSQGGDGKGRLTKEHWDNGSLDLIRDAQGQLLAAWTEYDGALWFSRSSDDGRTFTLPLQIAGSQAQPARAPSLARARGFDIHLIWASGESASRTLLHASSQDDGQTFGAPSAVIHSSGSLDAPKLALDDQGGLHLVYAEQLSSSGPSRIRYARRAPGASTFDSPRTVSAGQAATFPALGLGAPGQVAVAWHHQSSPGASPLGLRLALSRDGGGTFSAPEAVSTTDDTKLGVNGSRQGKLMSLLALNRQGKLALVQSTFRANDVSRVRLLRGQIPGR